MRNTADFSLWGLLSFGALLDEAGFPRGDVFSYTAAGAPWNNHSWGAGALFYRMLRDWGDIGLFLTQLALFTASVLTAAAIHRARTAAHRSSMADGLFFVFGLAGCWLMLSASAARFSAASFSLLGYVVVLWILDAYRRTPSTRAPWLLPPLTAIWINIHAGFAWGLGVIVFHLLWLAIERRKKQAMELGVVLLFCLGASLLNPYGWRWVLGVAEIWPAAGGARNLGPTYAGVYAGLALAALAAAALNARRDQRFPGALLLLAITGVAGWVRVELSPLFVLTALALGPPEMLRLAEFFDIPRRLRDLFGLLLPAGVATAAAVLIVLQLAQGIDVLRPRVGREYPLGAASYLEERPGPINVWAPVEWGEFLTWSLYPSGRVAMDGRWQSVYPEAVRTDYLRFWGPDTDVSAASDYDTTHVLVPAGDAALLTKLDDTAWLRVYEDSAAVVYARTPAAPVAPRSNDAVFVSELLGDLSRFARGR